MVDGLDHNCRRLVPLGPRCSAVCLCASEFPVDQREWPRIVSLPWGSPSTCSLSLSPPGGARMLLLERIRSLFCSMILSSYSLCSNSLLRDWANFLYKYYCIVLSACFGDKVVNGLLITLPVFHPVETIYSKAETVPIIIFSQSSPCPRLTSLVSDARFLSLWGF